MSERMSAEILIGGQVPRSLIPELCAKITAEGVSLDWGDPCFRPTSAQELLENCVEHEDSLVLQLCDDQASWGEFKDLEAFLVEHSIAFNRFTEGRYEFNFEWAAFRPGAAPQVFPTNSQREPQVSLKSVSDLCEQVTQARTAADQGQPDAVLRHLQELQWAIEELAPPLPPALESLTIA